MSSRDPNVHEIIIVKRRGGGHDDGHHGGVWKIAFADFMTAMMAFFLVLWIVNSTSKETRSSIARYFNPIRLAETTPARKGLRDPKESDFDAAADDRGNSQPTGPTQKPDNKESAAERTDAKPDDAKPARDASDAKAKGAEAGKGDVKSKAKTPSEGKATADGAKAEAKGKAEGGKTPEARNADGKPDPKAKPAPVERAQDSKGPTRLRPPQEGAGALRGGPNPDGEPPLANRQPIHDEAAISADPQAVLAEIAGGAMISAPGPKKPSPASPPQFRDPFAASSPVLTPRPRAQEQGSAETPRESVVGLGFRDAALAGDEPSETPRYARRQTEEDGVERDQGGGPKPEPLQGAGPKPEPLQGAGPKPEALQGAGPKEDPRDGAGPKPEPQQGAGPRPEAKATAARPAAPDAARAAPNGRDEAARAADGKSPEALRAEIVAAAAEIFGPARGPSIEVSRTPDGLLVSLTDSNAFEMFAIGSSEPHPRAIALMEKMAKVVERTPGALVVRGHTDARPWRKGVSDNWRLSASRAHMAYQMLLRGGFDAKRLERLEGLADRLPRNPADPLAPENRRIELLIRSKA